MKSHDLSEDVILERARRALSPRESDEARVLDKLMQRLGNSQTHERNQERDHEPSCGRHEAHEPPSARQMPPKTVPRAMSRVWLHSHIVPTVAGIASAALLSVLAVVVSRNNAKSTTEPRTPAPHTQPVLYLPRAEITAPAAEAELHAEQTGEQEPAPPPPQADDVKATEPAKQLPKERKPRKQTSCPAGRTCRKSTEALAEAYVPVPSPAATKPASSLRAELEAVRHAERALREHEPTRALAGLSAFEHTLLPAASDEAERPREKAALQEERDALKAIARCSLAAASGSVLAHEFERAHPASAYLERVRRSCRPGL